VLNSDAEADVEPVFSSDQSDSDGSESLPNDSDLAYDLSIWASQFNIPHNAVKDLLCKLRPAHPLLPKDPRTLLKTKTDYVVKNVGGSSYFHFGLQNVLLTELKSDVYSNQANVTVMRIQMNIDGLPLFKSSNTQFWPILGRTTHPVVSKPFAIGIFLGNGKPENVSDYLCDLIDDINILTATGLLIPHTGQHIQIKVSCVICDTPARAFVKQSKGHSGYLAATNVYKKDCMLTIE